MFAQLVVQQGGSCGVACLSLCHDKYDCYVSSQEVALAAEGCASSAASWCCVNAHSFIRCSPVQELKSDCSVGIIQNWLLMTNHVAVQACLLSRQAVSFCHHACANILPTSRRGRTESLTLRRDLFIYGRDTPRQKVYCCISRHPPNHIVRAKEHSS